ncbi:MAG: hydroxyisourate hydrolase [bacterium]
MKSPITTHVLDTSRGRPAEGVFVLLEAKNETGEWQKLGEDATNQDGRASDLLPADEPLTSGVYRLTFETGSYFRAAGLPSFYPNVVIAFEILDPAQHYHVPLLLSPFGYSTYRGS